MILRILLLGLVGGLLLPASSSAQIFPNEFEIAKLTCGEFLALDGEQRARALIYYNGYQDGRTSTKVWRDKEVGARVDRAIALCTATPKLPLLEAFGRAWKR